MAEMFTTLGLLKKLHICGHFLKEVTDPVYHCEVVVC